MTLFLILSLGFSISIVLFLVISFYIAVFGGGPFVPTKMEAVHAVLKAAKIKKNAVVYDIGAGDGRFIHFAEKNYHAQATGFELNPFVYFLAKLRQWFWGWKGKMIRANLKNQDLSKADILICYMMPGSLRRFQKQFDKQLKKGAKVVSYTFKVGDWKPSKIIPKTSSISSIYIYEK